MSATGTKRSLWRRLAPTAVVVLIGTLCTTWATLAVRDSESLLLHQSFEHEVMAAAREVELRLQAYSQTLRAVQSFAAADPELTRAQWTEFIEGLDLPRELPGLEGVALIERVPAADAAAFAARMRGIHGTSFEVFPPGERPSYRAVKYDRPTRAGRSAVGFDVGTDPVRRPAQDRAADTGQPALSSRTTLMQDDSARPAVVMYLPVYRPESPTSTVAERRQAIAGWVGAPIIIAELLDGTRIMQSARLHLCLHDGTEAGAENVLFDTRTQSADAGFHERGVASGLHAVQHVAFGGRHWRLEFTPGPTLITARTGAELLTTLTGLLITALLAGIVRTLSALNDRATVLARQMTRTLFESEERFRTAFDNAGVGMAIIEHEGNWTRVNAALCRMLGYEAGDLLRLHCDDVSHPEDVGRAEAEHRRLVAGDIHSYGFNQRFLHRTGRLIHARVNVSLVRDVNEEPDYCVYQIQDITAEKEAEEKLRQAALHDNLTLLPNRKLIQERIGQCLHRARIDSDYDFAVLFLDFDRFKWINDKHGHKIGDDFLVQIAGRLRRCLGQRVGTRTLGDRVAARLGGDEFVVLLDEVSDPDEARSVADQLLDQLSAPYDVAGLSLTTSASFGVVPAAREYEDVETLLRDADMAMYEAKKAGRARIVVFDHEMRRKLHAQTDIERELQAALDERQFVMRYQPIFDLASGALYGFEALLRWEHPEHGMIKPGQFLEAAESSGLIVPIGSWAIAEAARQLDAWRRYWTDRPLTMHVNLSRQQVEPRSLLKALRRAFREHPIDPSQLVLELNEDVFHNLSGGEAELLEEVSRLGVPIAMDEFGTGRSSIGYLHELPIEYLKIDRSFLRNLSRQYAAVAQAIVSLAESLGLTVIADGVESGDHLAQLQAVNCRLGQGYHFCRAVDASEMERLLQTGWSVRRSA